MPNGIPGCFIYYGIIHFMFTITRDESTGKWVAVLDMDGYKDTAIADRPGCAIRDVLNRMQYTMGQPSGDLVIEITGW